MKSRKNKITFLSLFLFVLILVISFYFFQRKAIIYEPVSLNFKNNYGVEVYGITPFNRTIPIFFKEKENQFSVGYCYLTKIIIRVRNGVDFSNCLLMNVGDKKFIIKINELIVLNRSESFIEYELPRYIKSPNNFLRRSISVFNWPIVKLIVLVLFLIFLLGLFLFLTSRLAEKKSMSLMEFIIDRKNGIIKSQKMSFIFRWAKIILLSIYIAFTLFFGFLLIVKTISTLVTGILLIITFWLFFKFVNEIFTYRFALIKKHKHSINIVINVFIVIVFIIEFFLRFYGINKSNSEYRGYFYKSGFEQKSPAESEDSILWINKKNHEFIDNQKEFSYKISTNSEGLRDVDHSIDKFSGEYRVVCLGNSYTEGMGAPQDSTYPKLLGDKLKSLVNRNITVFNAGKSASDPFFQYMLLKKRILKYQPDLVLLNLGSTDLFFYTFRGGFERFTKDGIKFRKAPWWEKIYAASYLFRYYINNILEFKYFMSVDNYQKDCNKAEKDIKSCIYEFYELSLKYHFKLITVFYDDRQTRYQRLKNELKKECLFPVFDLFEYNKNVANVSSNYESFVWPIDRHFNSKGYELYADGVVWNLEKIGLIDSLNSK